MQRVLASATLEQIKPSPNPLWEVTVTGEPPHDHRRIYTLGGKSDNEAAMEGIRQFVAEMECLSVGD